VLGWTKTGWSASTVGPPAKVVSRLRSRLARCRRLGLQLADHIGKLVHFAVHRAGGEQLCRKDQD
jgi:hypothetical protein